MATDMLAALLEPPRYSLSQVLGSYGWVAAISFAVSAAATPAVRALAMRLRIVDSPDGFLKPHQRPVAYGGGIGVYLGWVAGMLVLLPDTEPGRTWVLGLTISSGVILAVGLADDLFDIRPTMKLAGQVAAAVILLLFGIGQDIVLIVVMSLQVFWPQLFCPDWLVLALSAPMAILLVVATCNATNLLDGMDGLCTGVTGIISIFFLLLATHLAMYAYSENTDQVRVVVSLAMAGAVCGFLPYNFSPATIFLGDAGSMLLGFFAGVMMLMFGEQGVLRWVLGAVMIFGLPILDTSLALIRRIRLGHPIFGGDRSHLYDQLVDRGFTARQTVAICYGLSIFYGLMGVAIILIRTRYAVLIYVGVAAVTLLLCQRWGFLKPPQETPLEQAESDPAQADT